MLARHGTALHHTKLQAHAPRRTHAPCGPHMLAHLLYAHHQLKTRHSTVSTVQSSPVQSSPVQSCNCSFLFFHANTKPARHEMKTKDPACPIAPHRTTPHLTTVGMERCN